MDRTRYFDESLWPHLRAAYNVARWIVRNDHDAEDVVQESFVKAFLSLEGFRGGEPRAWLLTIVRNTALTLLRRRRADPATTWNESVPEPVDRASGPEGQLLKDARQQRVRNAIDQLPEEFRETLVLRELEGLSYKEIAAVLDVPIGTVMSRLARARGLLVRDLVVERGAGGELSRS